MSNKQLIDRLAGELKPVRRRSLRTEMLIVAGLCLGELALYLSMGFMRPDMSAAMTRPSFWWKLSSLGLIAVLGAVTALASFNPAVSPRRGLRQLVVLVVLCLAVGWFLDASQAGLASLVARLDWHNGLRCVYAMVTLSLLPVFGLGLLMRRGAPTDTVGTAVAVGVAAAAWGAFVFVFACPFDDPLYLAVWYTVGCTLVTLSARLLLPPLVRW